MDNKLYIPEKVVVGFRERGDTYTGKLAYIIYRDEKGKLRKEGSWNSWRDKNIETVEIDNTPQSNFVFNKGVQRCNYHFGSGRSVIRIYDQRDIEFEISVDNLIGILMNTDVYKRDIVDDCVYAWSGKDLILLPTSSQEYKDSVEYTKKQYKKVSARDLIKGATYSQKKDDNNLIYVGRFDWYANEGWGHTKDPAHKGKKHVFYNPERNTFCTPAPTTQLAECVEEECVSNYAEVVDKFLAGENSSPIEGVVFKDVSRGQEERLLIKPNQHNLFDGLSYHNNEGKVYLHHISICKGQVVSQKDEIGLNLNRAQWHWNNTRNNLEKLNKLGFDLDFTKPQDHRSSVNKKDLMDQAIDLGYKVPYYKYKNGLTKKVG